MSPAAKPMSVPSRRPAGFSGASQQNTAPSEIEPPAPPAPVPGTPDPASPETRENAAGVTDTDSPIRRTARARERGTTESHAAAPAKLRKPGGYRHQTNFRLYETEMEYLRHQLRGFEDDGIKTDATELVHALVYAARRGELELLPLLRRWREDINAI